MLAPPHFRGRGGGDPPKGGRARAASPPISLTLGGGRCVGGVGGVGVWECSAWRRAWTTTFRSRSTASCCTSASPSGPPTLPATPRHEPPPPLARAAPPAPPPGPGPTRPKLVSNGGGQVLEDEEGDDHGCGGPRRVPSRSVGEDFLLKRHVLDHQFQRGKGQLSVVR